jgi:hypothetical protein
MPKLQLLQQIVAQHVFCLVSIDLWGGEIEKEATAAAISKHELPDFQGVGR